jgi:hypothetical protein
MIRFARRAILRTFRSFLSLHFAWSSGLLPSDVNAYLSTCCIRNGCD